MITLSATELDRIEHEVARYPKAVQQHYRKMVKAGQSPRFALMCAVRQAPSTRYSDRTFNAERQRAMTSMGDYTRGKYLELAKRAGISTQGKFYVGSLGRPTDPAAWVSTVDDAKDVCRAKNLTADGLVKHQGTEVPYKRVRMADDIKQSLVAQRLQADPELAAACASDPAKVRRVEGEVLDRHAPGSTP
jgi:hypothetical protein